jgi:peroxiredoxin
MWDMRATDPLFLRLLLAVAVAWSVPTAAFAQGDSLQSLPEGAAAIPSFPKKGHVLPPFDYVTLSGRHVTNDTLAGKSTVLVLWSRDCPGSQRVVGDLLELKRQLETRNARLWLASVDTATMAVRSALGNVADSLDVLLASPATVFMDPDVRARYKPGVPMAVIVPSVVVLDTSGVVQYAAPWPAATSASDLVRILDEWLPHDGEGSVKPNMRSK